MMRGIRSLWMALALVACYAELGSINVALADDQLQEQASVLISGAEDGSIDSSGVKIHYVSLGKPEDPLLVMIHGFPDFWFTWRAQMPALAKRFHVVAIDQRGYNYSDKPEGVANYAVDKLVADVVAVVRHFGGRKAVIVGHDWGGLVAWTFAMTHPELTDRLIVLNLPHPRGLMREMATNPNQQRNSQYARDFQKPDAAQKLSPMLLSMWVKDPEARKIYQRALKRSSMEGMLNYYKANYPKSPEEAKARLGAIPDGTNDPAKPNGAGVPNATYPAVTCPVLLIHGLNDQALLPGALNDTWSWLNADLTLVTIPGAGHFVQQDAADLVTRSMVSWLGR
jgi:epoxide hydrolase 4